MDTDGSVFTDALAELLYGYFGDLHSAMVQRSPFAGETYHFDYATHPNLSSSIGATLSTGERYAAARSVSACVDESGALIPYQEVGNTAYITFDSFDMDLGRDYYDPEVRQAIPGMIAADNIALTVPGHVQGALASAPLIGSLSQVANFTTLYEDIPLPRRVEGLYQE